MNLSDTNPPRHSLSVVPNDIAATLVAASQLRPKSGSFLPRRTLTALTNPSMIWETHPSSLILLCRIVSADTVRSIKHKENI
jgi:hypothetical protein